MYFNEGGSHRLVGPFEGCAAARVLACPAAKKRPHVQATRPAKQQHRAEVHEKGSKKSSEPSLEKSLAGDVHSGGQDWHPSAGMRYRLARS